MIKHPFSASQMERKSNRNYLAHCCVYRIAGNLHRFHGIASFSEFLCEEWESVRAVTRKSYSRQGKRVGGNPRKFLFAKYSTLTNSESFHPQKFPRPRSTKALRVDQAHPPRPRTTWNAIFSKNPGPWCPVCFACFCKSIVWHTCVQKTHELRSNTNFIAFLVM